MKKTRTRTLAALAALALGAGLAGCGAQQQDTLTIASDATPHAEILKHIQESGQLTDVTIEIEPITGQVDPNQLLEAGDVDANFFQHKPYLDDWQRQNNTTDLVTLAATHIEPMAIYSNKYASLAEIPDGATIAVPKDPTNFARALYVLQGAGLLTMAEPDSSTANLSTITADSIADNPKNLTFVELDRPQLPRTLDDPQVSASVINSNYAIEAGLVPSEDGLFVEAKEDNPYANFVVTTQSRVDEAGMQELKAALESQETADWIKQTYGESIVAVHGAQ